jgi:hypothetical protein
VFEYDLADPPSIILNKKVTVLLFILLAAITYSVILSSPVVLAKSSGGGLKQIPSESTDYPDNNPNLIEIQTFKSNKDIVNWYHIRGEIKNISHETLSSIGITAHLFDSNSQPIGTASAFLSDLQPGHSQTYDALVEAKELSGKPNFYRLSFEWETSDSGDEDNAGSSSSTPSSSSSDQLSSNKPQVEHSKTLQIPKSSSSPVIPSQNTITASPPQQQSSFLTYENPTYGFTMQYPSNWSIKEQPEAGRIVSFDEINKGVQVYIKYDKLPFQYSTLTQYVNTLVNQLGSDRKDFSLTEYYPNLTLHNNPAYKVVYLSTKKVGVNIGTHYETMRLWMIKDDNVYTLVYVTQPNLFPQYLPIANNMLKSFKITR